MKSFVLKGDICFSPTQDKIETYKDNYLVCKNGLCAGVFEQIPEEFSNLKIYDYSGKIVIPGFIDLHTHAAQYANIGIGMDKELLDWLDTLTFPEESRFSDTGYAERVYTQFTKALTNSSTTRAVIYATIHNKSTEVLADMLGAAGLGAYVGKVTMDRNAPEQLLENTEEVFQNLETFVLDIQNRYPLVKPIITPRFIPSCSDDACLSCAKIAKKYDLPVQSHLDENRGEIELVSELCPDSVSYTDAYVRRNLIDHNIKGVMAHCIYLSDNEIEIIKNSKVFIAHCPQSNINICSGIAPALKYMQMGLNIGLGTDISAGANLEMERAIVDAINVSKLLSVYDNNTERCLKLSEAFYMATKGGGKFFGHVGSFEKGYEFDAVVVDDSALNVLPCKTIEQRLERSIYHYGQCSVAAKFVAGNKIAPK